MYAYPIHRGKHFEIFAIAKRENEIIYQSELFDHLDADFQSKLVARIDFLANTLPPIRNDNVCKKLQDNLFELKAKKGNLKARLLFFYDGKKIVITHGFLKKTQKTPEKEIKRAVQLRDAILVN